MFLHTRSRHAVSPLWWGWSLWEPAKMPRQNIMFATPFVTSDVVLAIEVMNELNDTIPEMKEECEKHNRVFLGATVSDTYHIFTTFPVDGLADLEGKKIVGASSLGPWLEGTGAVPVARSEERRVGKEGVSTCRSRWSPSP